MRAHQSRVINEKAELDQRIKKLHSFIGGELFDSLSTEEQDRMGRQEDIMSQYSAVLGERIDAFPSGR